MIAKKVPANPRGGTKAEVAAQYGLTPEELGRAMYDFTQCEGFTPDGHECMNLHEWLTYDGKYQDRTPWQKGDDQPI